MANYNIVRPTFHNHREDGPDVPLAARAPRNVRRHPQAERSWREDHLSARSLLALLEERNPDASNHRASYRLTRSLVKKTPIFSQNNGLFSPIFASFEPKSSDLIAHLVIVLIVLASR